MNGTLVRETTKKGRISLLNPEGYHVFASDDLPSQYEAAFHTIGVNGDHLHWLGRPR